MPCSVIKKEVSLNMATLQQQLKVLFDFQRFAKNTRLAKRIHEMQVRLGTEPGPVISDDDLEMVSAAGDLDTKKAEGKKKGKDVNEH